MRTVIFEDLTRWENRWIACAAENAYFSKDPGTKVGTVIIGPCGKRRVSEGYNGLPQKIKDSVGRLADQGYKYPATIHAEMNAILFARRDLRFHNLFTTQPPCDRCAAHIVQVGITQVTWMAPTDDYWSRWEEQSLFGRELMEEADIKLTEVQL